LARVKKKHNICMAISEDRMFWMNILNRLADVESWNSVLGANGHSFEAADPPE
jgi:hypothetical protein